MEAIYYNGQNNFTLQFPVLLAPLRRSDSEETALRKMRIVASYIEILIARRIWNWKSTSYSAMQYNMFQLVILSIRNRSAEELVDILCQRLGSEEEAFATNDRFRLHGMNGRSIHRLLARMTDYVETQSGRASDIPNTFRGAERMAMKSNMSGPISRIATQMSFPRRRLRGIP